MTTSNKNFKVKNGLEVLGTSATVNGNEVLTVASILDSLADVNISQIVNGQTIVFDSQTNTFIPGDIGSGGGSGVEVVVSDTAPENAVSKTLWYNSLSGGLFIRYMDGDSAQWVQIGITGPAGKDADFNVSDTPPDNPVLNEIWYSSVTGGLFIRLNPDYWVQIGVVGADGVDGSPGAMGPTGPQGPIGPTGPQGPTGVTNVSGANDVALVSLANNDLFTYNSSTSKWNNSTLSAAGIAPASNPTLSGSVNISGTLAVSGTTSTAAINSGAITATGNVNPQATNSYDLGTASLRWRNIYTQDLNLSNGIGDYTMIEGEENLYLVNNKSGKHFKFALIEVDPSEVPAKSES